MRYNNRHIQRSQRILGILLALILIFTFHAQAQFFPGQQIIGRGLIVSMSGDLLITGDRNDDDSGFASGAAYIFERQDNNSWQRIAKLTASDAAGGDRLGESVSIDGSRAVAGSRGDDDNGNRSGSAYVFEQQGDGSWQQVAKLTAADAAADDEFGSSVAVSGDRIAVGALGDDDNGFASGSVYIFERQGNGSWQEVAKLIASDGAEFDVLGVSVFLRGDRLVIGAPHTAGGALGSAYVFERQGDGSWQEVAKFNASDGQPSDLFGTNVSLDNDRIVIGAPGLPSANLLGSAYIFERQGDGSWQQVAILNAPGGAPANLFGVGVSVSGDRVVAGEPGNDDQGTSAGAAHVFARQSDGSWPRVNRLIAFDAMSSDSFGVSVTISGDNIAVGSPRLNDPDTVYLFSPTITLLPPPCDCDNATHAGTPGNDKHAGTPGNDIMCGFGGNDRIFGEGGHDCIDGGSGNDRLFGGSGNDILLGRSGDDHLRGEAGHDLLNGNRDNDVIHGGEGDDILQGESGNDTLRGDAGEDSLSGGSGDDNLRGGSNDDIIEGDTGNDSLRGNDGNDILRGGTGDDIVDGDDGNDNLSGNSGNDIVKGDAGNDRMFGNSGNDMMRGGAGADVLFGDAGDDDLNGGGDSDILSGGNGNDILRGGSGNDSLNGLRGIDVCDGGSGVDSANSTCEEIIRVP
ncbi:MAG: hypothetical protein ETSY1_37905 [Candidatus Entotheonella factor]|uniref:Calcium-binding protein n=1 Tax=Entotheonella factor TaxID=1429438 RepID=W4L7U3_ENTF1|nr:MAG: hypothetical protein ETSY1_37905 [Candidatus Entotheonella factor]